jgi:hypothetical protein
MLRSHNLGMRGGLLHAAAAATATADNRNSCAGGGGSRDPFGGDAVQGTGEQQQGLLLPQVRRCGVVVGEAQRESECLWSKKWMIRDRYSVNIRISLQ